MTVEPGERAILLADDVAGFLEVEKTFFENEEVRLLTASSGDEALAKIREHRPDLVLIDESMPNLKGHEVCREVKADPATRNIPVVIVTASSDAAVIDTCMAAGCDDYLVKPVSKRLVLNVAEKFLNTRQRRAMRMLVKLAHAELGLSAAPDHFFGYTIDVSDRGMLLEVGEAVSRDERLDLQFFLPGSSEKIQAEGRVVRDGKGGPVGPSGDPAIGIEFSRLSDASRDQLRQYVARMGPPAMRFLAE